MSRRTYRVDDADPTTDPESFRYVGEFRYLVIVDDKPVISTSRTGRARVLGFHVRANAEKAAARVTQNGVGMQATVRDTRPE